MVRIVGVAGGTAIDSPLRRIRRGALVLAAIFVVSVAGYHLLGYSWLEAIWMVVVTISSVGYSESSESHTAVQLLTIGLIVSGMSAAAYAIGGFIQMMLEGEVERLMGHRRRTREIQDLKDHVVICGYGRMGQILATELRDHERPLIVLDLDGERVAEALRDGIPALQGDATEESTLLGAGLERASSLVSVLPSDAENVFITLTTRNLRPTIQIIARAEHPSTESKLRQAGADKLVMPAMVGARQMVRMITRPSTADLMDLVAESSVLDVELDEIRIRGDSGLIGRSIEDTQARRNYGLLVAAVKKADGTMLFNPPADYTFGDGDVAIVMGNRPDIGRFRSTYQV